MSKLLVLALLAVGCSGGEDGSGFDSALHEVVECGPVRNAPLCEQACAINPLPPSDGPACETATGHCSNTFAIGLSAVGCCRAADDDIIRFSECE